MRLMKKTSTLIFKDEPSIKQSSIIDEYIYSQYYKVITSKKNSSEADKPLNEEKHINVKITGQLVVFWNLKESISDLKKVLFEYGKRHIIEKLKDRTLQESEELILTTNNQPDDECPLDLEKITNPSNTILEIKLPEKTIVENIQSSSLAASIIENRDYINAIYKMKHKCKILTLNQERKLLELFRSVESQEELSFRISSLASLVTDLNIDELRKITDINDSNTKSISLLEAFLEKLNYKGDDIIKPLRKINHIRQAYPIHTDEVKGLLKTFEYFKIIYPINDNDPNEVWKILMSSYLKSLKEFLKVLKLNYQPQLSKP